MAEGTSAFGRTASRGGSHTWLCLRHGRFAVFHILLLVSQDLAHLLERSSQEVLASPLAGIKSVRVIGGHADAPFRVVGGGLGNGPAPGGEELSSQSRVRFELGEERGARHLGRRRVPALGVEGRHLTPNELGVSGRVDCGHEARQGGAVVHDACLAEHDAGLRGPDMEAGGEARAPCDLWELEDVGLLCQVEVGEGAAAIEEHGLRLGGHNVPPNLLYRRLEPQNFLELKTALYSCISSRFPGGNAHSRRGDVRGVLVGYLWREVFAR